MNRYRFSISNRSEVWTFKDGMFITAVIMSEKSLSKFMTFLNKSKAERVFKHVWILDK